MSCCTGSCMGETWQQMLDDRCPYPVMVRAGLAAIQYQGALLNGLDTDDRYRASPSPSGNPV
jgi:hypothetical protein